MGVLAVQHADPRPYDNVEIEALQTVAMVLAELIASAELIDDSSSNRDAGRQTKAMRLTGQKLVIGMAAGMAVFHKPRINI